MTFDRSDWETRKGIRRKNRVLQHEADLRKIAQAAPAMEALTGNPHWDVFLQVVQARAEDTRNQLEAAKSAIVESPPLSTEQLIAERMVLKAYKTRLDTLLEVVNLPRELMEQADKAREALSELESD